MSAKKTTQYFIGHKPFSLPEGIPNAKVIQVGLQPSFSELRDNTGDQIAKKNPNYCELTAIYWIWKNDRDSDRVGINHYRRWFSGLEHPEQIEKILDEYDLILPVFEPYRETVREQYCIDSGFQKDLDLIEEEIRVRAPEYEKAFQEVMRMGGISQYNMMILPKNLFDEYCSWVFPLLEKLESQISLEGYNDYQKRIFGFLSERLVNVWVRGRKLKVYEMKVIQPEMNLKDKFRLKIRQSRNRRLFRSRYGYDNRKPAAE